MKNLILLIMVVCLGYTAQSQNPLNASALRLVAGDRALAGTLNGTIYYDIPLNKFYFRQNNAWVELGSGATVLPNGDKGDITVTGNGSGMIIDNGAVTFPKMESIPEQRVLGRALGAGFGPPAQLTGSQVNEILPIFGTVQKGLVPPSGVASTSNFLRSDGVWASPPAGGSGGTTETASNGLLKSGSDIRMGGPIFADTDINWDHGPSFRLWNNTYQSGLVSGSTANALGFGVGLVGGDYVAKANAYSWITSTNLGGRIEIYSENASNENVRLQIGADGSGALFIDNRTVKKGIQYSTTGFVTQPTSLADKHYVDSKVAEVSNQTLPDGDKGHITVTNQGATWTIDNDVVSYGKIQNVNANVVLGRTGTTGDVQELTGGTVSTLLPSYSGGAKGLVPVNGTGNLTGTYLRGDGTWQAISAGQTYSVFTSVANGLTPASGGGTAKYLRADGTWQTPPSGTTYSTFTRTVNGLVPAPGGSTTTRFLREDGTWVTPSSGGGSTSPGGSSGAVQFNNGGVFGGDAEWNFNSSTNTQTMYYTTGSTTVYTKQTGIDFSASNDGVSSIVLDGTGVRSQSKALSLAAPSNMEIFLMNNDIVIGTVRAELATPSTAKTIVQVGNMPMSPTGLQEGTLWVDPNDGWNIKMVPYTGH